MNYQQTNMNQIAEWRIISSPNLDDTDLGYGKFDGLNSMGNKLIQDGFVPHGEPIISFTPTYQMPRTSSTLGGGIVFTQQFVKYKT